MAACLGRLRLAPSVFWAMTPKELEAKKAEEKQTVQDKKKIPTLRRPTDPDPNPPAPVKKK